MYLFEDDTQVPKLGRPNQARGRMGRNLLMATTIEEFETYYGITEEDNAFFYWKWMEDQKKEAFEFYKRKFGHVPRRVREYFSDAFSDNNLDSS